MSSKQLVVTVLLALGALNAYLDLLYVRVTRQIASARPPPVEHYSFVEQDYVPRVPLPNARRGGVKWIPEESVRYSISSPETSDEWLWTGTVGDGNAHFGDNHRFFVVGITHQLHCLRSYRQALEEVNPPQGHTLTHLTHCLNFFRMHTLCAADTTLEPSDVLTRNFSMQREGTEHVCMDWDAFYKEMRDNYVQWVEFKEHQAVIAKEL